MIAYASPGQWMPFAVLLVGVLAPILYAAWKETR